MAMGAPIPSILKADTLSSSFSLSNKKYKLQKTFRELATWKFSGWSRDERYCLIIGGRQRLTMDRLGPDRLFILEPAKGILKQIFAAPYLDSARFAGSNRVSVFREMMLTDDNGKDHLSRVKVTLTLDGKIVSKQATD